MFNSREFNFGCYFWLVVLLAIGIVLGYVLGKVF